MRIVDVIIGAVVGAGVFTVTAIVSGWIQLTRDFVLGLAAGLVSSALVVIILGIIRSPRLTLEVGEVADGRYPQGAFRFVHVNVSNSGLKIWRWQVRRPATLCRAELAFGDLGANAPRFTIDGRWSSLPEPVQSTPLGAVVDAGAVLVKPREVINPADSVLLCVAIKENTVTECFAFNNRSYLHLPKWSNPAWSLGTGTYWVRVRVVAAEVEESRVFELVNTGQQHTGLHLRTRSQ